MAHDNDEPSAASAGSVEPVAWAVMSGDIVYDIYDIEGEAVAISLWLRDEEDDGSWVTVPLYPTRHTFTDAERDDLAIAADAYAGNDDDPDCERIAATLRRLLERLK